VRFALRVKNWCSYTPILDTIAHYRRADFGPDVAAGVVAGIITVPQAIAYALLAGLPDQAGLYACLAQMVIYAVFGSSRHLVVGPVAVAALMVAAAIGENAPAYGHAYLAISTVLCLQAGLFLWLLRLWNMGGVVNLLIHPVIVGFVNAAALIIIASQLIALTGISDGNHPDLWQRLKLLMVQAPTANIATTLIGIICIGALWLIRIQVVPLVQTLFRPWGMAPEGTQTIARMGPLIVASVAILVVWIWDLGLTAGVATVTTFRRVYRN
jgi:SulP family sulfate permease